MKKWTILWLGTFLAILFIIIFSIQSKNLPDPSEKKMGDLRESSIIEIESLFESLEESNGFIFYNSSYYHGCAKGQHNLDVDDNYDNICGIRITRFYALNGKLNRDDALIIEEKLMELGWEGQHLNKRINLISFAIESVYDPYNDPEKYFELYGKYRSNFSKNPSLANLLSSGLIYVLDPKRDQRGVMKRGYGEKVLSISFEDDTTDDFYFYDRNQIKPILGKMRLYVELENINSSGVFKEINKDYQNGVMISISKLYFRN